MIFNKLRSAIIIVVISMICSTHVLSNSVQDSNLVIINRVDQLNGIYNRLVNFSFQSSDGYIWLATQDGLYKFDGSYLEYVDLGTRFENLLKWGGILEDEQQNLWLFLTNTINGKPRLFLLEYNQEKTRKIIDFTSFFENHSAYPPVKIVESFYDGISVRFHNGIVMNISYDALSKKLIKHSEKSFREYDDVAELEYSPAGYILIYKNGDVKLWDILQDRKFLIYTFDRENVIRAFTDIKGNIKLVDFGEDNQEYSSRVVNFDPSTGEIDLSVHDFGYKPGGIFNTLEKIFFDKFNDELIYQFGNYVEYVGNEFSRNKEYRDLLLNFQKRRFSSHLLCLDPDTRGFSTRNGFYILKRKKILFASLNEQNEFFINNSIRRFVTIDDNTMGAEGYSGVVFFDRNTLSPTNNHPFIKKLRANYNLGNGDIFRLTNLGADKILFYDKWRKRYVIGNIRTNEFDDLRSDIKLNVLNQDIWSTYKLDDNTFLVSNPKVILKVDLQDQVVTDVGPDLFNSFEKLAGKEIYQFLDIDSSRTLVASSQGLYLMDKNERQIVEQLKIENPNHPALIDDLQVHYILRISEDLFYLGTNSRGLIKYSLKDGVIRHISAFDDKKISAIHYIEQTKNGSLILATNNKLITYNETKNQIYTYFVNDGLTISEFNRVAYFESDNNLLYLGGINGAVVFDPEEVTFDNKNSDKVVRISKVEWFDVNDLKYKPLDFDITNFGGIKLTNEKKSVRLTLSSVSYGDGKANYYHGLRSSGNDYKQSADNLIYIDNLDFGRDTLKVYAEYNFGSFKSDILKVPIQYVKPFYLNNYFFLFLGITLVVIIYLYTMIRERNSLVLRQNLEALVESRTKENRKQALELEELTKLKDKFFINISHELKTPLSLIKGPIEKLSMKPTFKNEEKVLLNMASSNVQRLSELIKEILDLSKLELGKQEVNLSSFDLVNFIRNRVDQFSIRAKTKNVKIIFESNTKSIVGFFDKKMVHTVISNLVDNSLRHADSISTLKIKIKSVGDKVDIYIIDNGKGISENKLKYLFDRFHTISKYESGSSLGIGLAISKEFADLMGGDLTVSSKVGVGTSFIFRLPMISNKESEEDYLITESATAPIELDSIVDDKRYDILVVEDNKQLATFIELLLKDNYNVSVCYNGKEAWDYLNLVDTKRPQLIISDIMMPKMDGFELLEFIKSDRDFEDVAFLFLSARDSKEDILKALRIGVEDYLSKPFLESELLVVVENLLNNYKVRINSKKKYIEEFTNTQQEASNQNSVEYESINLDEGLPLADKEFLEELDKYIEENMERLEFTIEDLSFHLAISSRQLRRKIQKLTGFTPNQYIRKYKMNVARSLLESRSVYSVKELSYKLGFKSSAHFAKLFKNHFGRNPSDFV
jgi:signal transduction histidine kinase/DNA-binding response OmpR family regulator